MPDKTDGVNTKNPIKKALIVFSIITILLLSLILIIREFDLFRIRASIFPAPTDTELPSIKGGTLIEVPAPGHGKSDRISRGYFAKNGIDLVVLFHGNGETMAGMGLLGWRLFEEGFSVLLAEYPGYGVSRQYKPSENAIYEDSTALIEYIMKNYGFRSDQIIMLGYSLGTGVAVEMAKRKLAAKIVLLAPITSIPSVASRRIPIIPWLIVRDVFDNKQKASGIELPVLIIHGTKDTTVPFEEGVELVRTFRHGELIPVEGADHRLPVFVVNNDRVWKKIGSFLNN